MLNGRRLKSTLPRYDQVYPEIRQTDTKSKERTKEYADKRSHAKSTDLNIGDKVVIKQPKKDKMSSPFNPEPLEIKDRKGNMITAQNEEHTVTRNSSFFKKLPSDVPVQPIPSDDEERTTPLTETVESVEPVTQAGPVEPVEGVESSERPTLRRSGRIRREPEYFKDYITYTLLQGLCY